MKPLTTELTTMPRKARNRWSAYLTDDQNAAADAAMRKAGYSSASDWLRDLVQRECERQDIVWPEADLKWGDINRISRIRNRKNEGEKA